MSATLNASAQPAMFAGRDRAQRMPFFMCTACMAATASIILLETDVLASVSLVARILSLTLILVLVGVLLTLSGLTGFERLVGLITGLHLSVAQGD